jgi:hypothetical protein
MITLAKTGNSTGAPRRDLQRSRDRAYPVVAVSLIASRSQFAHAAYKTSLFENFESISWQSVVCSEFALDRIALSGEPAK